MRADPQFFSIRTRRASALARPLAAAIALAWLSAPAMAQSVSDYRLPEQRQDSRQDRAQGPVDAENPVVAPTTQAPPRQAAPAPAPSAAPTISLPPPPRDVATPAASPTPVPRATSRATPPSGAQVAPQPSAAATPAGPLPKAVTESTAEAPAQELPTPAVTPPVEAEAAPASPAPAVPWWWAVLAAALVGLTGLVLVLRRRNRQLRTDDADWAEPEPAQAAAPQPAPPAKLSDPARAQTPPRPAPAATPAAPVAPLPPSPAEALPLAVGFEPRAMRLSLVFATLPYRLSVENRGNDPIGPVRVLAGLGSAHASLSTTEQLAPDPATLELRHTLEVLAPGETVNLSGELRVPLGSVLPMRSGGASLFVPLARFCLIPDAGAAVRRVFMVGQPGTDASAPLTPIRLDTGPRQIDGLAAREIEAARLLALDPLRQAS